ncbi:MAG TPA: VapE domain-containing protein, partial [Candidatus Acidoferrum sp.]|nr:VapE domain-containing protein [Candidatus Acidoferrum sp.]
DQPRRCIFIGTTNDTTYLRDQTGNSRFWPVAVGKVDLEALRRDRDQLWGEAALLEATGAPLVLPKELRGAARAAQEKREDYDPWIDLLANVKGKPYPLEDGGGEERVASIALLEGHLRIPADRIQDFHEKRLGRCMRRLGWGGPTRMRIDGKSMRGYRRAVPCPNPGIPCSTPAWGSDR